MAHGRAMRRVVMISSRIGNGELPCEAGPVFSFHTRVLDPGPIPPLLAVLGVCPSRWEAAIGVRQASPEPLACMRTARLLTNRRGPSTFFSSFCLEIVGSYASHAMHVSRVSGGVAAGLPGELPTLSLGDLAWVLRGERVVLTVDACLRARGTIHAW